ncbi:hypothetical protein DFJ58DRAFT_848740 [Suillus subalutaceus]|uniref:uncharacterized protein n=1 Tax=Suillus subalutaceus TaxID=48586 RepID=UPI001B87B3B5|nr:uncharacterized protein DFJ58DRAFT_848740 [Suillus subalutaceus]KAG1829391.1 hypothetical protein DFJ58DRAFT_848740 [Suillus subalutaceus]
MPHNKGKTVGKADRAARNLRQLETELRHLQYDGTEIYESIPRYFTDSETTRQTYGDIPLSLLNICYCNYARAQHKHQYLAKFRDNWPFHDFMGCYLRNRVQYTKKQHPNLDDSETSMRRGAHGLQKKICSDHWPSSARKKRNQQRVPLSFLDHMMMQHITTMVNRSCLNHPRAFMLVLQYRGLNLHGHDQPDAEGRANELLVLSQLTGFATTTHQVLISAHHFFDTNSLLFNHVAQIAAANSFKIVSIIILHACRFSIDHKCCPASCLPDYALDVSLHSPVTCTPVTCTVLPHSSSASIIVQFQ